MPQEIFVYEFNGLDKPFGQTIRIYFSQLFLFAINQWIPYYSKKKNHFIDHKK